MNRRLFMLAPLIVLLLLPVVPSNFNGYDRPTSEFVISEAVYATTLVEEIYNAVSEQSFRDIIRELSENETRHYGSEQNEMAERWIVNELTNVSDGKLEVSVFGDYRSVIGKLPGTLGDDGPCVMVGGHYDTVVDAPGANDDGTGVATAIELARIFSQYEWPLDMYFCAWNAEEIGLFGSDEFARHFALNQRDLLVYFNIDMLLIQDPDAPPDAKVHMIFNAHPGNIYQDSKVWADLTRAMNNNYDKPVIMPIPSTTFPFWPQSDHYPFWSIGYKSTIFAFESGIYLDHAFHTPNDTWDNPDYNYTTAAHTVASIGASLGFIMSRTQGELARSKYDIFLGPYDSREIMTVNTIGSDIRVNATWSGASSSGLSFTLKNPSGVEIDSNSTSENNGDSEIIFNSHSDDFGIHTVTITNTGSGSVNLELEIAHEFDIEGNGIPDHDETWYNDFNVDSDSDTLSDGFEELYGLDRYNGDSDFDGVLDGTEISLGIDPLRIDSDSDNMPDGFEIEYDLDPTINDADLDPDADLATNLEEFNAGTNPQNNDTDSDSILDGWELQYGLDPLIDDSLLDPDGDNLNNLGEFLYGLNPNVADWIDPVVLVILGGAGAGIAIVLVVLIRKRKS